MRAGGALIGVAIVHAVASVLFGSPHMALSWDETVYVSRLNRLYLTVPAAGLPMAYRPWLLRIGWSEHSFTDAGTRWTIHLAPRGACR